MTTSKRDIAMENAVELDHANCLSAAKKLRSLVEKGASETQLSNFIGDHKYLILFHFTHGFSVVRHFKFGTKYVADFIVLDCPSHFDHWILVELESPALKMFTKSGRRSAKLEHAIQQIRDWRSFIQSNIDQVRKPIEDGGLGLRDMTLNPPAIIWGGRRQTLGVNETQFRTLREQIHNETGVSLRTWDGFTEWAIKRATYFQKGGEQGQLGDL